MERVLWTETYPSGTRLAVVKWEGYPDEDATAEPICRIKHTMAWKKFRSKWNRLNKKGVFEVQSILARRMVKGVPQVHVHWAGTRISDAQWIPESNLM